VGLQVDGHLTDFVKEQGAAIAASILPIMPPRRAPVKEPSV
jgi:hypothetical protein